MTQNQLRRTLIRPRRDATLRGSQVYPTIEFRRILVRLIDMEPQRSRVTSDAWQVDGVNNEARVPRRSRDDRSNYSRVRERPHDKDHAERRRSSDVG